jgi:hypothetical protein
MYKNGAPVNPHRVKAPATKPISGASRAEFDIHAAKLMAELTDKAPVKTANALQAADPAEN